MFDVSVVFLSALRSSLLSACLVKFSNEISIGSALSSITTGIVCSTGDPTTVPSVTIADTFKLRGLASVEK